MSAIEQVIGRQVLDSRGNPTVEAEVVLASGAMGRAIAPSGASTGTHEAVELRDGGDAWMGKGVQRAVSHVNGEIAGALAGKDLSQRQLDEAMIALDGTATKSRLGANALLGVSMAALRAEALARRLPLHEHIGSLYGTTQYTLPVPMMNILNGGAHADSSVDIQEFMVMPVGASSFAEALRTGAEIFHALRSILKGRGQSTGVGDEGGFAPNLKSNREAVEVVLEAIGKVGLKAGQDVYIALDVASSELWAGPSDAPEAGGGNYVFKKSGEPGRTSAQMVELYADWIRQYPIISIEDGLAEGDWSGWQLITKTLGDKVGNERFDLWFSDQVSFEYSNGTLWVRAPDSFTLDRLRTKLRAEIGTIPTVIVGKTLALPTVDCVLNDEYVGARLAVDHLHALGHRRIAHVSGGSGAGAAGRKSAYIAAMSGLGLKQHIDVKLAAKLAEMSVEDFKFLNPAHNKPVINSNLALAEEVSIHNRSFPIKNRRSVASGCGVNLRICSKRP